MGPGCPCSGCPWRIFGRPRQPSSPIRFSNAARAWQQRFRVELAGRRQVQARTPGAASRWTWCWAGSESGKMLDRGAAALSDGRLAAGHERAFRLSAAEPCVRPAQHIPARGAVLCVIGHSRWWLALSQITPLSRNLTACHKTKRSGPARFFLTGAARGHYDRRGNKTNEGSAVAEKTQAEKRSEAGKKAALTRKRREAGKKAAQTRKRREAARKAAQTRAAKKQG
jgi:hypothetical protein